MISLILISTLLFAHEDLPSTTCRSDKETISITRLGENNYNVELPGGKTYSKLKDPQTKDVFDPKLKQIFDTYTFDENSFKLVVKRPETEGQIKNKIALWNNKTFNCQ